MARRSVRILIVPLMLAGMIGAASPAIGSMASPGARGPAQAGASVVVKQVISDYDSNCALLTSGKVYCWGYGLSGELGDGKSVASATPVAVIRTSGTGALSGVASLASDGQGVCAVLASGGVDCWGYGGEGELGNGTFGGASRPVTVKGIGGKGTLTGVAGIAPYHAFGGSAGYCALLKSGRVDCWGFGLYGQLGDGKFYTTGNEGSAVPVAVKGLRGSGTLTGVASLDSTGGNGFTSNCARLTSGGVDCWGYGQEGQLGNGVAYTTGNDGSDVPVAVKGTGGKGTLTGVASLDEGYNAFCAVRTSGAVDCWGFDFGQLGDGSSAQPQASVPVAVKGVGGSGTLSGAASLSSADEESFCAALTSGKAACWGSIANPYPTPVTGVSGSGRLTGVANMAATAFDASNTFCARLTTGGADCWGNGGQGELGDGSNNFTVLTPVKVSGTGGSGHLAGVAAITGSQGDGNFCAITSGKEDCWGFGNDGELGNGASISSDVPVAVRLP